MKRKIKRQGGRVSKRRKVANTVRSVAAKAAGAALGYIGGNVTGAVAGYKAGGALAAWSSRRKKKTKKFVSISRNNDLTVHNLKPVFMGSKKKILKHNGIYKYTNTGQVVYSNVQGDQAYGQAENILPRESVNGTTSNVRNNATGIFDTLWDLNPFSNVTSTNSIHTGAPTTATNGDAMHIQRVDSNLSVVNLTKLPLEVIIYYITPNTDTNVNAVDAWTKAVAAEAYGQPEATGLATTIGTTTYAANPGGKQNPSQWGTTPFEYAMYKKYYRALASEKVVLQPGDQRHLALSLIYNKTIYRNDMDLRNQSKLKGLTVIPFIIARSGMVGVATGASAPVTEVAFGAPKVGVIHRIKYTFKAMPFTRQSVSRNMNNLVVNDSTDTFKAVDGDDGEVNDLGVDAFQI